MLAITRAVARISSQRNPQTRDPRFIREFKAKHAIEVWGEDRSGKK